MIGPATAKILHTHDIHSIGDFAQASPELIKTLLNKNYL
jgi:nucleotidyltransferase/DNA polymerase involved in DNA repair